MKVPVANLNTIPTGVVYGIVVLLVDHGGGGRLRREL